MKVSCPKCHGEVPAADINVAKDVAFCPRCQEAFALSTLVAAAEAGPEVDPGNPPPGCRLEPLPNGFAISASARSGAAFFFTFFALFWNSIVSVFVVITLANVIQHGFSQSAFDNAPFPGFEFIFLTPFVLVGLVMTGVALTTMFGKVVVTVAGNAAAIFTGVGRLGWTRRFAWSDIDSATEEYDASTRVNNQPVRRIVLDGKRQIKFATLLNEDRRRYVASVLRQVLAERKPA
jgi:hypothetical protein